MGFKVDDIKRFAYHLNVKGAYVQDPGDKPKIRCLSPTQILFSVDASSLYPSSMILSNISEESLYARIFDNIIVSKTIELIKITIDGKLSVDQAVNVFKNAIQMQITGYHKREKPDKMKERLEFNVNYYTYIFQKIVSSGYTFDQICQPVDNRSYYLLKSYLLALLEAISWTSPYNKGYSNTVIDYVFYPDKWDNKYKESGVWVFENIYSTKSTLKFYNQKDFEDLASRYLLNPYGVLFYRHKDKLAKDILFLDNAMAERKIIKNHMIVFDQILSRINDGNNAAKQIANMILEGKQDEITDQMIEEAKIKNVLIEKKTKITDLSLQGSGDIKNILSLKVFALNLRQGAIKVFINSAFGIKGLVSFPFAANVLGNAITSAGKFYGIKTAQNVAHQVIEAYKLMPD